MGLALVIVTLAMLVASVAAQEEVKEISVGVLVDLSGDLSTYGKDIKNALTIAEEDINGYFEKKNKPYKIKFYFEDTKVDPKITSEKTMDLYARGINLIIGPMGSGEVQNILGYISKNKIVIISPSSTALPKNIGVTKPEEKKYAFRFVATDAYQTKAIARELSDMGIKAVVIAYIGNAWGKGLYECIEPKLEDLGIEIKDVIEYSSPAPSDFTPYLSKMEDDVNDLLKKYKNDEIAIIAFSYEEVATMIAQAKKDSVLFKVYWIGCDGTAKSSKVVSEVCDKAKIVGLYSTLFESKGKAYDEFEARYKEGFNAVPYQYGMNAYDAAWVIALAYAEVYDELGKYDPDAMAEKIPVVTEKYSEGAYEVTPITGYIKLDEYNDRASGDYMIYYVTENCEWEKAGLWKSTEDKIEWYKKPSLQVAAPTPSPQTPTPTPETKAPGFELLVALGVLAVIVAIRRL